MLLDARVKNRNGPESYWTTTAASFVPYKGELIIYTPDSTHATPRVKIGDGSTVVGSLPFIIDLEMTETEVETILDSIF